MKLEMISKLIEFENADMVADGAARGFTAAFPSCCPAA